MGAFGSFGFRRFPAVFGVKGLGVFRTEGFSGPLRPWTSVLKARIPRQIVMTILAVRRVLVGSHINIWGFTDQEQGFCIHALSFQQPKIDNPAKLGLQQ